MRRALLQSRLPSTCAASQDLRHPHRCSHVSTSETTPVQPQRAPSAYAPPQALRSQFLPDRVRNLVESLYYPGVIKPVLLPDRFVDLEDHPMCRPLAVRHRPQAVRLTPGAPRVQPAIPSPTPCSYSLTGSSMRNGCSRSPPSGRHSSSCTNQAPVALAALLLKM